MNLMTEESERLKQWLLESVPELGPEYETTVKYWDGEDPGVYNILEEVVNPYLASCLDSPGDPEALSRLFQFVETLSTAPEPEIREAAAVTVIENLTRKRRWLDRARPFMGPQTLSTAKKMEEAWGVGE